MPVVAHFEMVPCCCYKSSEKKLKIINYIQDQTLWKQRLKVENFLRQTVHGISVQISER